MKKEVLKAISVSKSFGGVRALVDFSLSLNSGEVHGLVGANGSGKTTFMNVLAGVVKPDDSERTEIIVGGRRFRTLTPKEAIDEGIQVIYQSLYLLPSLSVAENIALNQRIEEGTRFVSWADTRRIALRAMEKISVQLDPDEIVGNYSIAKQQIIAICRAITSGVKVLIMDEPTASLGKKDVENLLEIIRKLKKSGVSVLFVSHKLREVFAIADRITVIRDGKRIASFDSVEKTSEQELTRFMTGKTVETAAAYVFDQRREPVLEVKNLSKKGQFEDINLRLRPGEILGLIGLVGSGRTELALSIFGLNRPDRGEILIHGTPVQIRNVGDAIKHGLGYLPENRLTQGLFLEKSIQDNVLSTVIREFQTAGLLLQKQNMVQFVNGWIEKLSILAPSAETPVNHLSGGNQQRVVLSKWLSTNPKVLILDGPTVGIDVGAKDEIHKYIRNMASQGVGIIMISDEVHEVLNTANKIVVMREGRITKIVNSSSISETELTALLQ